MRNPSLQYSAFVSFLIHATLIISSVFFFKQSKQISLHQPIIVNLISQETSISGNNTNHVELSHQLEDTLKNSNKFNIKSKKDFTEEKELIERKISAIAAKKKIENIVRLRSILISSKVGTVKNIPLQNVNMNTSGNVSGNVFDDYFAKITKQIWQQWIYPDIGKKNVEAIISIKILKNGTLIIQNIEKSSGNPLFDKSALKALTKANPLPPPPYEIEIGVRFFL
jgi:colicin import membrane protein